MISDPILGRVAVAVAAAVAAASLMGHTARAETSDDPFAGAAQLERAALVQEVLRRNPSLQAARAAWRAAQARVAQERALDDPMLSYEIAPLSLFAADVPLGHTVKIEQRLPVPGTRDLRAEMARADAAMARGTWAETELALAMTASMLYDDWYVAHRALDINAHHRAAMETLKRSAEAQYVVGRASQQEPLRAEIALAEMLQELAMLEARRDMVRAEINGLLHRAPEAALPPPPAELAVREAPPPPTEELQALALRRRPELAATRAERAGKQAAVDLARKSYYPEIGLMASYSSMFMEAPHQYMVGVSLELPIYRDKRRAAVDEARAGLARTSHGQEQLEDEIRVEVEKARQSLIEAMRVAELYRTRVMPAARDREAAARAGFASGRGDFAMVLEAENDLRSVELRTQMALADVSRRDAELARMLGVLFGVGPSAGISVGTSAGTSAVPGAAPGAPQRKAGR
jgi:cobalt-zinc-cadmium efflux system outer membrane protein